MTLRAHRPFAGVVLTGLLATSALMAPTAARGQAARAQPRPTSKALTSAEECGRCHRDIFRYWKASLHAQSADDARFQAVFTKVKEETHRQDLDQICLRCHAPALLQAQDFKWERKVSWEGVTCDFCHSVRSVRNDPKTPFILEVGEVKSGPLRDAKPTVHGARYAESFSSSMLCNPCHQFVNEKGLEVLSTYAEWQASPYPGQSKTCQSCHMRSTAGKVVDPTVARVAMTSVNLHEMPGGHSVTELNRALGAQITAERRGGNVDVNVQLTNRGAGHKIPTGSPLRSIVMVVQVAGGTGSAQTATRTYRRVVVDENNQEITEESGVWLRGARVLRDDRLAPAERRAEKFSFPMPANTPVRAVAKFYYRYAPGDTPSKVESGQPFLSVSSWLDAAR
ncbi:MAG: multiheme c-type cytochrome [Bacteroidales bacterium]